MYIYLKDISLNFEISSGINWKICNMKRYPEILKISQNRTHLKKTEILHILGYLTYFEISWLFFQISQVYNLSVVSDASDRHPPPGRQTGGGGKGAVEASPPPPPPRPRRGEEGPPQQGQMDLLSLDERPLMNGLLLHIIQAESRWIRLYFELPDAFRTNRMFGHWINQGYPLKWYGSGIPN